MTKLEELNAAQAAAWDAYAAACAVLDDARAAACAAVAFDGYDSFGAACAAEATAEAVYDDAYTARDAARDAYWAELKKIQEENSND
jgi:hypothetical protein